MVEWAEMCEVTKKELDRELLEQEISFLKWVYDRYLEEKAAEEKLESN